MTEFMRPPLKWAGGKYNQLGRVFSALGIGETSAATYIEPFVGAGAVFLNVNGPAVIADLNETLIAFYVSLRDNGPRFIEMCQDLFHRAHNTRDAYEHFRDEFNHRDVDSTRKAALLLYLNKHCYNGLYRVNNDGGFNVPFGRADDIRFPMQSMMFMWRRLAGTIVVHADFETTMEWAHDGSFIYCDPPYAPRSPTEAFTGYTSGGFPWSFHVKLEECAWRAAGRGSRVVVSNVDVPHVRELYQRASRVVSHIGKRTISTRTDKRTPVAEILAIYEPR